VINTDEMKKTFIQAWNLRADEERIRRETIDGVFGLLYEFSVNLDDDCERAIRALAEPQPEEERE